MVQLIAQSTVRIVALGFQYVPPSSEGLKCLLCNKFVTSCDADTNNSALALMERVIVAICLSNPLRFKSHADVLRSSYTCESFREVSQLIVCITVGLQDVLNLWTLFQDSGSILP